VYERAPNEKRDPKILVEEGFEVVERIFEQVDWWWHKERVGGIRASDPVLAAAEFAGRSLFAAHAGEQLRVHLSDQSLAQGQRRKAAQSVLESANVVEDLTLVLGLDSELCLGGEHVAERRLRTFDPRTGHSLPSQVRPNQKVRIRQAGS
jgi:hypothetical protein